MGRSSNEADATLSRKDSRPLLFILLFHSPGVVGTVADFEAIAVRIFEKDGVVPWTFVIARAFNVPPSGQDYNLSQSVHLAGALHPERDA